MHGSVSDPLPGTKVREGGGDCFRFFIFPLENDRDKLGLLNFVRFLRNRWKVLGGVLKNLSPILPEYVRKGRKLVLNHCVLVLREIDVKGSVVSSLLCFAEIKREYLQSAFLCCCCCFSWPLFTWKGRGTAVSIELWPYSSFNGKAGG